MITTSAEDDLGQIHDRMPMIVEPERFSAWLDPDVSEPEEPARCWCPPRPGDSRPTPCPAVNNVRNNGHELVEPLAAEGADPA